MQKTLTLTAAEPSEDQELDAALHARSFICAMNNHMEHLRRLSKYESVEWAEKAKDLLWQEVENYDLDRFFR